MNRPQAYLDTVEAIAERAVAQRKEDRDRFIHESCDGSEWTFNANRLRERFGESADSAMASGRAYNEMIVDVEESVVRQLKDKLSLVEEQWEEIASRLTDIDNAITEHGDDEAETVYDSTDMIRGILGIPLED